MPSGVPGAEAPALGGNPRRQREGKGEHWPSWQQDTALRDKVQPLQAQKPRRCHSNLEAEAGTGDASRALWEASQNDKVTRLFWLTRTQCAWS